jgi:glycosyltransferase involved in cell wall biosynthesis
MCKEVKVESVRTVLLVHEYYQQPGGEDQVFAAERGLLEAREHRVVRYTDHNDRVKDMGSLTLARATVWNGTVYNELRRLLRAERPQVAHFHNTFPLISPAAYYAARAEGVPVVQTLHNYRLFCTNALFFRDGHPCEDCLGKTVPWPGVLHSCYRGSRAASGMVAAMLSTHRMLRTWTKMVDRYIALTDFAREKLIQGGLPKEKIAIKPHFIDPDPGLGEGHGGYALFVGRLSPEKGSDTLLSAWERLGGKPRLKIVGDGPLAQRTAEAAQRFPGVEWLGRQPLEEVYRLMGGATFLVFPSEVYETFGRVAIEAFARGTPVVASKIGAIAELVEHGHTGLHFRPGDPNDLAAQVKWASRHPEELGHMRKAARAEFEAKYTARRNYELLMEIYRTAAQHA